MAASGKRSKVTSTETPPKPKVYINNSTFVLYDSIRLFYDNGGGVCYIVPIGDYSDTPALDDFTAGIEALETNDIDEVTLLLFPDAAAGLTDADQLAAVQNAALKHCADLGDRFAILDIKKFDSPEIDDVQTFRNKISSNAEQLRYGAAYYPYLSTVYTKGFTFDDVSNYTVGFTVRVKPISDELMETLEDIITPDPDSLTDEEARLTLELRKKAISTQIPGYDDIVKELNARATLIPPSGAIAGIISATDRNRGVWKAPANVSIASVSGLSDIITNQTQADLNIDSNAGKSVNAIRAFTGKGILVWGARTLDGNSNEWRYIPVRRLFNYIEESIQKSTAWAVFSPNDGNTWIKIKCQIENFLNNLWRVGALAGSTPESAYIVNVGLGSSMTAEDIQNGLLIVEIALAAVRPSEFIVLRFSHKVQE
ncbi:hypothetical protein AGMMS50239_38270 [Bacteroidia bacterium]|nr:hypothetical protein AGMMS50239_38270 [Bacteroidia bacterium]